MLGKILGAVAGKRAAEHSGKMGGAKGAVLGAVAGSMIRRASVPTLIAFTVGGVSKLLRLASALSRLSFHFFSA